jgi:alkylation response protein AidB-like acyl-CoA dehydrogenase
MLLSLSADQEFFRQTTAKFLAERVPVAELRRRRDDPVGFDREYWRQGADLGWMSLLVSEAHGGGSLSGQGLVDLGLIAYEFGRAAAPGPFVTSNLVAAALDEAGGPAAQEILDQVRTGAAIVAWCCDERQPGNPFGHVALQVRVDGGDVVVSGAKRPVESGAVADQLLVVGRTGDGLTQVLVPSGAPGVSVEPLHTVDLTRRFSTITFDDVRVPVASLVGPAGEAGSQVERQGQLAVALLNAESVGAMQTAFDLTVEWAFDRYSFGRPLASYQELKHRFADMKTWLEASHAASDAATAALAAGAPEAAELLSAAKAFIGSYGSELLHDCVQLHGGIGVTFEHDLHLYLRRHTVNRALCGTPAEHRQRLTDLLEQREDAA